MSRAHRGVGTVTIIKHGWLDGIRKGKVDMGQLKWLRASVGMLALAAIGVSIASAGGSTGFETLEAGKTLIIAQEIPINIVFVGYDAEESGLVGSRAFVQDDVIPIDQTRFQLVFDMIGGKFFPWTPKSVIAMGSEHSPQVRSILHRELKDRPLEVKVMGTYVLEPMGPLISRSDYQAYRAEEVPYLFFSTGRDSPVRDASSAFRE